MTGSSLAGIITAVASVLTAVGLVITAVGVLLPNLRATRDVHTIVNQQRTDMQRYQAALVAALRRAGVDVPADQSLPPTEPEPK